MEEKKVFINTTFEVFNYPEVINALDIFGRCQDVDVDRWSDVLEFQDMIYQKRDFYRKGIKEIYRSFGAKDNGQGGFYFPKEISKETQTKAAQKLIDFAKQPLIFEREKFVVDKSFLGKNGQGLSPSDLTALKDFIDYSSIFKKPETELKK